MTSINSAIKFHGHLGPWLILGLSMGEYALKKIKADKYFGLSVTVSGLNKRPRSCLIDGLQLSSGCTLGKGNIRIIKSKNIFVNFKNTKNKKKITLRLKSSLLNKLKSTNGHPASERLAKTLYKQEPDKLFSTTDNC